MIDQNTELRIVELRADCVWPYLPEPVSAVYGIRNKVNGRLYIGSAADLMKRWHSHRTHLRKGRHHSVTLQRSWDKYGARAFVFFTIEIVERSRLVETEQFWISWHRSFEKEHGFNISPTAASPQGTRRSPESRARMSAAALGKKKQPWSAERKANYVPHNKGKKASAETRAKISAVQKGKSRKPHSAATRLKISVAAKKRGIPRATQEAAWAACKGRLRWRKGNQLALPMELPS